MVVADGRKAAHAGEDALAPAAEARHDVVRARAKADHKIGRRHGTVHPHGRVVRCGAEIDEIGCLAVVVFHAEAVKNGVGDERAQLAFAAARVRAVGHDDGHVGGIDAADCGQVVRQVRNDQILPHPEARDVAHDQRDLLPRHSQRPQRRGVDGVIQTLPQRLFNIGQRGDGFAVQHAEHLTLVQRQRHAAFSVCK